MQSTIAEAIPGNKSNVCADIFCPRKSIINLRNNNSVLSKQYY